MAIFGRAKKGIINLLGVMVGYAEMLGLKYPVKKYRFQVSDALWRGSRLNAAAIADLRQEGFRLIVNLCAENNADSKPGKYYGIKTLHIPIIDNTPPKMDQVMAFLNAVRDSSNIPTYIHCEAGIGRTGTMCACYRIAIQGWTAADAIAEAKQFGLAMPSQEEFIERFSKEWKR